jgi:hypothetical protein
MKSLYSTIKTSLFLILLCLIPFHSQSQITTGLYVNEVMASNNSTITDNVGAYSDWIEIYNANPFDVDLANYYLTDLATNLTKFRLTSTGGEVVVPANGYLLIWASGTVANGSNHTSFSLSAGGEYIGLTAPDGTTLINGFTFPVQRPNISYGRETDGSSTLKYFSPSSPNQLNDSNNAYNEVLSPPVFSHAGGFYGSSFSLNLSHSDPNVQIIYTLDSSIPTYANLTPQEYNYKNHIPSGPLLSRYYQSNIYANPLLIEDRSPLPNEISNITTTVSDDTPEYIPDVPIKKGSVIRAIAYKAGALPSEVITNTYFINSTGQNPYNLPVVSLAIQETHLFDYNDGIYTPGIGIENGSGANYLRSTEFPAHFELIEQNTQSHKQNMGFRIHGSYSRTLPMKTLRMYASNDYSTDRLNYQLFPNSSLTNYKRFMLKNFGNDFNSFNLPVTLLRDATGQELVRHLNIETQNYRPSAVYMNGEFWGLHDITERYDKYYINQQYNSNTENLDIIKNGEVEEGDNTHYSNLIDYIAYNPLFVQSNYDYIKTQMDIQNYTDYQISEIFLDNTDWVYNNVQFWRERVAYNPTAPKGRDGRWRWMLFDLDMSFAQSSDNLLNFAINNQVILPALLQNDNYKSYFINRFADLLNTTFLPSRTTAVVDANKQKIESNIPEMIERWSNIGSLGEWQNNVNSLNSFLNIRPYFQSEQIKQEFGINGEYTLTVDVSSASQGYVHVNTINILPTTVGVNSSPYPWTGNYFNNIPIQIIARAKSGYKFKHWLHDNTTILSDSIQNITTDVAQNYLAVFEEDIIVPPTQVPTAKNISNNCTYSLKAWNSSETAGSYPSNMVFVYMNDDYPTLSAAIAGFATGAYNLTSRTRINGLGNQGIAFINTDNASGNPGYPGRKLGGAILALNTTNFSEVFVSWKGRTITPNPSQYNIRLQYRIGDTGAFTDILNANGQPVNYVRSSIAGDSTVFNDIMLPTAALNQPYVQLFWRYYSINTVSGARDQLAIDDIFIGVQKTESGNSASGNLSVNADKIVSTANLSATNNMLYQATKSIELKPGFISTSDDNVFVARIVGCSN